MGLIDFILNLAALLLWLNWRSVRFDPLARRTPATLIGTLRPAEPRRQGGWKRWISMALMLGCLLAGRALLYIYIGSPANWTPKLDLGLITLAFRSDLWQTAWLCSFLSFFRVLVIFYFWLLVLAALNHRALEPDPVLKLIRLHLGGLSRWPWPVQLAIPLLLVAGLWAGLHPLLAGLQVVDRATSAVHLLEQALLVSIGLVISLKLFLPVLLLLHLVASYVYLGSSPVWDFIVGTCRVLLAPVRAFRIGKLDLAPLVGVLLIFLILHLLPHKLLAELKVRGISLWPQ